MNEFCGKRIAKTLPLKNGCRVVLLDTLGLPESVPRCEVVRNVFCIRPDLSILWQIGEPDPIYEPAPFTNVYFDDQGRLRAYAWDGVDYAVDEETGDVTPEQLLR